LRKAIHNLSQMPSSPIEATLLSDERLAISVQVECRIEVEYESEAQARNVASSISLDNGDYASAEVIGKRLVIVSSAPSAPSMLHTLEDLMACLKIADQVVKGISPSPTTGEEE
jgi:hypothetical protein